MRIYAQKKGEAYASHIRVQTSSKERISVLETGRAFTAITRAYGRTFLREKIDLIASQASSDVNYSMRLLH